MNDTLGSYYCVSCKGLYNQLILMGGTGLAPWALSRKPRLYAQDLARRLACPLNFPIQTLDCLRLRPLDDLLQAYEQQRSVSPIVCRIYFNLISFKRTLTDDELQLCAKNLLPYPRITTCLPTVPSTDQLSTSFCPAQQGSCPGTLGKRCK